MTSEITFEGDQVKQPNFHDYQVLRHPYSPEAIRTHLVHDSLSVTPDGV